MIAEPEIKQETDVDVQDSTDDIVYYTVFALDKRTGARVRIGAKVRRTRTQATFDREDILFAAGDLLLKNRIIVGEVLA